MSMEDESNTAYIGTVNSDELDKIDKKGRATMKDQLYGDISLSI